MAVLFTIFSWLYSTVVHSQYFQVHVKAWLESVSCLNLDSTLDEFNPAVTCRPKFSDSAISVDPDASKLPSFLQDQQTLGGTKELLESMQVIRI